MITLKYVIIASIVLFEYIQYFPTRFFIIPMVIGVAPYDIQYI